MIYFHIFSQTLESSVVNDFIGDPFPPSFVPKVFTMFFNHKLMVFLHMFQFFLVKWFIAKPRTILLIVSKLFIPSHSFVIEISFRYPFFLFAQEAGYDFQFKEASPSCMRSVRVSPSN